MKITPLEVREYHFKKVFRGYDPAEVETLKGLLAEVLEELVREKKALEAELKKVKEELEEYHQREKLLKETLTMAQKAAEEIRESAKREAEVIISEARLKGEEIVRSAHARFADIQGEIDRLKNHKIRLESEIKAILEYYQKIIFSNEDGEEKIETIRPKVE